MKRIYWITSVLLAAGLFAGAAVAGEHPEGHEHPAGSASEHPAEHPQKKDEKKSEVSKRDLARFIEAYVEKKADKKGFFVVEDEEKGKKLKLKLDKVHEDKLAKVGDSTYFVCADFDAGKDKTYDLDFFLKGKDKDSLKVTEITVHKEDGKERYTWHEQKGLWVKKKVGSGKEHLEEHPKDKKGSGSEHPHEHPGN